MQKNKPKVFFVEICIKIGAAVLWQAYQFQMLLK
jgi:hypothetical protein